jgi:hypothetical protein
MSCQELFWLLMAREQEDPELFAAHFLTVTCYNIQHPAQFKEEAVVWLEQGLIEHLDHGTPVAELRKRAAARFQGNTRVLVKEAKRRPVRRRWPMTIAEVCLPERLEGAAERVKTWAASIRSSLPGVAEAPNPD